MNRQSLIGYRNGQGFIYNLSAVSKLLFFLAFSRRCDGYLRYSSYFMHCRVFPQPVLNYRAFVIGMFPLFSCLQQYLPC